MPGPQSSYSTRKEEGRKRRLDPVSSAQLKTTMSSSDGESGGDLAVVSEPQKLQRKVHAGGAITKEYLKVVRGAGGADWRIFFLSKKSWLFM